MKILLTGSSGLIGSGLRESLTQDDHAVIRLVRTSSPSEPNTVLWNPNAEVLPESDLLENLDAVVHLAGESISGRWTSGKKRRILRSRVEGTHLLARTLANLTHKPSVFISASAVGYYGNTGSQPVDESRSPGEGFLSNVCVAWEQATRPAEEAGIRTIHARFGMVLDEHGGALQTMLPFFRKGLGGIVGNGRQMMSWISRTDTIRALRFLAISENITGPVNLVAPGAVTNWDFTKALGTAVGKPTPFPLPACLAKLMFGEMGEELLLSSVHVKPGVLMNHGFAFQHETLDTALKDLS